MRFHDTAMLDDLLADTFLRFLKDTEDIAKAERMSMDYVFERASVAFGDALSDMDAKLADEVPRTWRVHEHVRRRPIAEFGRIEYSQTVYVDEAGEHRRYLDEIIGMPARVRITPNAADALAECACSTSYANAADLIARHCRVRVSEASVAAIVSDVGVMLKSESACAADDLFDLGVDPGGSISADTLICEADGVWVSTCKRGHDGNPKKTEIKNFVAYTGKAEGRLKNRVIHAGVEKPASFWKQSVAATGALISLGKLSRTYLGCDGASWCKAGRDFLPKDPIVFLDKWHVMHNIKAALPDKAEVSAASRIVRRHGSRALCAWLSLRHKGDEKAATLKRYIDNNADIIDMRVSLGAIEGENAHVISDRMEAWGCAWSVQGADAMARMRAARANGHPLPQRRRNVMHDEDHWMRLSKKIDKKMRYDVAPIGERYEYPHKVETKKLPARPEYLLTRWELSSIPY